MGIPFLPSFRVFSTRFSIRFALIGGALLWTSPIALHAQGVIAGSAVNFGSVNVCPAGATTPSPCSQTETLSYNVYGPITIGSIKILTLGAPDLDFKAEANDTSTTLCKAQTYASATTCTVDVTFVPLAPGQRRGAVEILDGSDEVLATTYIYATGTGPAIAFSPPPSPLDSGFPVLGSGITEPQAVAVDASGNLFVVDGSAVKEILAAGGYTTTHTLSSGFVSPSGVALDGSGNVFVADYGGNKLYEILSAGGYVTVNTMGGRLISYPWGVAVDGSGDVYVANYGSGTVYEILEADGYSGALTVSSTNETGGEIPLGVAVDGNDNVFITGDGGSVFEILAVVGYTTVNTLHCCGGPGVALDASGDIYVVDHVYDSGGFVGYVYEILAAGGYTTANVLGNGFTDPFGVAVDGRGNVYVADHGSTGILEIPRSQAPSLSFAAIVGSTSSPQSVTVQNIGNVPLDAKGDGLTVSSNWDLVPGSGTPPDCTSSFTLMPSAECNLSISFEPTAAGPLSGAATLTDNALNAAAPNYATQTIQLSGSGVSSGSAPLAQVASTLQFGNIAFPSTETLPLTITNIGGGTLTVAASINGFNGPGFKGPSYEITGSTCGAGVTTGNNCMLEIQFSPVKVGPHDDFLTLITNGTTNPTVSLQGRALGVGADVTILKFGTIAYGSNEMLLLPIRNAGVAGTVTVTESISGPSYKVLTTAQNTCLAGVAAYQTCMVPIEFDPVSAAWHIDTLTVTSSSGTVSKVELRGLATVAP